MLQPGTLTSTSLGRVRVSSAVCAITLPPGSPPGRHYTQVPRVLPQEHVRPRPNPPQDTPPRTPLSPPLCPCWRPTPGHLIRSPQHPYTGWPTTPEPLSGHRPFPPSPPVLPLLLPACSASRTPPLTRAPAPPLTLRHARRSS